MIHKVDIKTGEGTALAWIGSVTSLLTIDVSPVLSQIASSGTIVLTALLIYKAILDIKNHKKRD